MKFTDGLWLLRDGVRLDRAMELRRMDLLPDGIQAVVATRRITSRGDTLQGPLLTWTLSSPREGIIKVRIEHFQGPGLAGPKPCFPIEPEPGYSPVIREESDGVVLDAGGLQARLSGPTWNLEFLQDGRLVTSTGSGNAGFAVVDGKPHIREQLLLGVGETVYGLGERFTAFVKNGQSLENCNKDGGTGSDQAYKSVPFYLSSRGYGVLLHEAGHASFEVATENVSRVQFSLPGESLEYFVLAGPKPADVLSRLTGLTGRPPLVPAWAFGLWLTTSFTTSYDEKTCNSFIQGMIDRDIPLHVFHYDCFWMREYEWCSFEWDPAVFPDPEGMIERLHDLGLKVSVWINSYIAQLSPLFAEAARSGYFLKRPDGTPWQSDLWQPGMAIVDFTNPEACRWFAGQIRRLAAMGVDSIKTDFGERIPTEGVVYFNGADPATMHNLYPLLYNRCVYEALHDARGEAVLFARSTYAGGQKYPVHWGGDCSSTFESMGESLRGGLSLGLCGFAYWSHDIGGFEGTPSPDVYKRWIAFGLLSPLSRLHGSTSYRVPWLVDEESCDVLRHFTKLKCALMPYIYAAAVEATQTGLPIMRAMLLEFPDDPNAWQLDRQFLLGPSLLVAPVLSADGEVSYYLPEGVWTDYVTGLERSGGQWVRETHDFLSLPLFVRENSLIPVGLNDSRPDSDFHVSCKVQIFRPLPGKAATCVIPRPDGTAAGAVTARLSGHALVVEWSGDLPDISFEWIGVDGAFVCDGGGVRQTERGLLITPQAGGRSVRIERRASEESLLALA
jgi:alpha-D-xyloside xylohydrolase